MRVNQFRDLAGKLLQQGVNDLSMTLGVLARIENDNYEIIAVQSNSGAYVAGEKYALGETFCRDVFEQQKVVAVVATEDMTLTRHHPLYRSLPLECYLGAPITRDGKPWGCIDFSSMAQRDEQFTPAEIETIEALARQISQFLDDME